MPTPYEPAAAHPRAGMPPRPEVSGPPRPPLVRARGRGWTPGVCAAIARHLGLSPKAVRWSFVILTAFGGAGVVAYAFLWALTPEGDVVDDGTGQVAVASDRRQWGSLILIGAALVLVGGVLVLPILGGSLIGSVLLPLFTIAVGAIVAWSNLDEAQRSRWLESGTGPNRFGWMRVALGVGLTVTGILVLVTRGQSFSAVWDALLAAIAVLVGALIIAAPWAMRLWGDLRREQVAAARATERADIAAHLHDSVLQTLALIQRQSGDAAAVTRLARAQERELRTWLYDGPQGSQSTLAAAVTEVAHEVEDLHGQVVDLVVTGDRPYEPHGAALTQALREALLNAVRHGRAPVTAYVEIGPSGVEAFVRDRGTGFDLDDVPADRLGVRQSILGRMERHGGSARVRRRDDGTEVELRLPPLQGDQP
ncbi:MAG TPA: PspC domain-containing protein [Ornithinibacter sp.]|uniref:ATP-binding protein n=1 Tax=Ornithinibacter sp. TaxID=2862748 RepID=UPI002BC10FAD|nr:PspC domain-containing protein [Ornithinibacter sp.]HOT57189.1 PspC domain-containing protein [Ornithinibacter sp.]HQG17412.1 PspC domain-containing protein [Ornithinibacter sp.]HQV83624.1 PspC domain-containing protein [Ornithinibacter sp.]HQW74700.1 PspC domain-containing protein [Ornithinibacter sp.]HQX88220.1 PspC domain-containing protein [Ornithinibacter sp.]